MATQVAEYDVCTPAPIRVRDDVSSVLVVVLAGGRPMSIARVPRPVSGQLLPQDIGAAVDCGDRGQEGTAAEEPTTIVVCTHERPRDLVQCLHSLQPCSTRGHEIVVVNNAPRSDETSQVIRRAGFTEVIERRQGLNYARNAGVAAATRPLIAFVDDDVMVSNSWLAAVSAGFRNSGVGCVTGLVLPLELETPAQEEFELYCAHRRDVSPRTYSSTTLAPSAGGVVGMGANMAFRREVLHALGGFDTRLDAGTRTRSGGDTDMFARVLDAGYLIAYTPDAAVWHRHRRTDRELRACVFGYGVGLFSMLTKRLVEERDLGALVTGARWFVGPIAKAAAARLSARPATSWPVVLAEAAGAIVGPWCFGVEAWHHRRAAGAAAR